MATHPHIPTLRMGRNYRSLKRNPIKDFRSGDLMLEVSSVNAGVIRRDMIQRVQEARNALKAIPSARLLEICAEAGDYFRNKSLPLGDEGHTQSAAEYVRSLSSTSGLPHIMVERNMDKITHVLTNMKDILAGLSRGLDLEVLETGAGMQHGVPVAYFPTTNSMGIVMPSNSPAVNSLWVPSIALKIPVVIKPGREEPWTPYRLIQAFIAAGAPAEAFGFYPTDHEGSTAIMERCGRAMIFGDANTTAPYANNPKFQIHGPGFSKIIIGDDMIERWPEFIDIIARSVSDNGGRSCINASAVLVPKYGKEIARALAETLGPVKPTSADDPNARLSGFANPKMAEYMDGAIDADLSDGAIEMTAEYRDGPRKVVVDGGTYVRPTVVYCPSWDHPLANREFLFPYASVVEVPQTEVIDTMGPTLVVTAITEDELYINRLMDADNIDRLNIGPISTMKISWDQPHEGNLFEFLYRRRSYERAA